MQKSRHFFNVRLFFIKTMLKLNRDFDTVLIGAEGVRLQREKQVKGDPAGAKRQGAFCTAHAAVCVWSGNQLARLIKLL